MVERGTILSHSISSEAIEIDKVKVDRIANLPLPTCVKDIRSFLGHVGFYWRFSKDFNKVVKHLSSLLAKDASFHFSKVCELVFKTFNEALTTTSISYPPVCGESFELMCDVWDFVAMQLTP